MSLGILKIRQIESILEELRFDCVQSVPERWHRVFHDILELSAINHTSGATWILSDH